MRKTVLLMTIITLLSFTASAQTQNTENQVKPGMKPGDMFYWVENAVERAEVQIAGMIGGSDLKAKAIANNAEERLAEAKALEKENKTEKASELKKEYSEQINKSKKFAEKNKDPELTKKLDNITQKNQKVLEEIKKKTPGKADKGLGKALNNSKKNSRNPGTGKEVPGKENLTSEKLEQNKKPGKINRTVKESREVGEPVKSGEEEVNRTMNQQKENLNKTGNKLKNVTEESPVEKTERKSSKETVSGSGDDDENTSGTAGSVEKDVEKTMEKSGSGTSIP